MRMALIDLSSLQILRRWNAHQSVPQLREAWGALPEEPAHASLR